MTTGTDVVDLFYLNTPDKNVSFPLKPITSMESFHSTKGSL